MCSDYRHFMKFAYLYNRPVSVTKEWGVEKVYADTSATKRMERADMLAYGLCKGDSLYLASRSDIGRGREVPAILERIADMGVTLHILNTDGDKPKPRGRPGRTPALNPPADKKDQICTLWRSGLDQSYVLTRAAEIAEVEEVTRNQMNRLCGPRHKKQKKQKEVDQ